MATTGRDEDVLPQSEFGPVAAVETVAGGAVVVANRRGMWICRDSEARSVGLALASQHTGDRQVVRQLLAGCLVAACPQRAGLASPEAEPSLEDYIFDLCLTYQTTAATPSTLRTARDRFAAIGDRRAADLAEQKAVEETGHDRLALRDLEALALPGGLLVHACVPALGRTLVQSFKELSVAERPYGVFGYAYVLERMAMMRTDREIAGIQALAPPGTDITRCRRVHSAVGVDTDHVADLIEFTTGLSVADRLTVCRAVHQTAHFIAERRDQRTEKQALAALLTSWGWRPFVGVTEDLSSVRRTMMNG